jgi:hypothetical protein
MESWIFSCFKNLWLMEEAMLRPIEAMFSAMTDFIQGTEWDATRETQNSQYECFYPRVNPVDAPKYATVHLGTIAQSFMMAASALSQNLLCGLEESL